MTWPALSPLILSDSAKMFSASAGDLVLIVCWCTLVLLLAGLRRRSALPAASAPLPVRPAPAATEALPVSVRVGHADPLASWRANGPSAPPPGGGSSAGRAERDDRDGDGGLLADSWRPRNPR